MSIILLGGNGFIGYHLAQALQPMHEVKVISRSSPAEGFAVPGVQYIQGDSSDKETLRNHIGPGDIVVLLAYATVPKASFENPLKDINENLPLAVTVFTTLKDIPVKRLLFLSSGGTIYGKVAMQKAIVEDCSTAPISPYGITKLSIEKYAHLYAELFGLPAVVARPSNPYGPYQVPFKGQGFIATAIASILSGQQVGIFGKEGTIRDYIHIDDLIAGIMVLLFEELKGEMVFNIGSGTGLSNLDVMHYLKPLAEQRGMTVNIDFLPERHFDVPYNVLDSSRLAGYGWQPRIAFEAGIASTWNWYLHNRISQ